MITLKELNPHDYKLNEEQEANIKILHERINIIRSNYGKPMIVTSGVRNEADQARINPAAPKSNHLKAAACDIYDKDGELYKWCKANEALLVHVGLWCEEQQGPWQHFQIFPPKSGNRFFKP